MLLIWTDPGRKLGPSLVDPHLPEPDSDQLEWVGIFVRSQVEKWVSLTRGRHAFQTKRLNVVLRPSNNPEYSFDNVAIVVYQRTPG